MRPLPEREPHADFEIEKAITFLVKHIQKSGHNPKPVIFHSLRVGLYLFDCKYNVSIVVAGLLHDVVEDSDVTFAEINEAFGPNVTEIVRANTIDATSGDRTKQGQLRIQQCLKSGKEALIIMAADMLDNTHYLDPRRDENFARFWVAEKIDFVEVSRPLLSHEKVWQELNQQCEKLQAVLQ